MSAVRVRHRPPRFALSGYAWRSHESRSGEACPAWSVAQAKTDWGSTGFREIPKIALWKSLREEEAVLAKAMDSIPFAKIADIPAFPDEYALVTQSVADDGTLLFLFVENAGREAVRGKEIGKGGVRFARTWMETPMRFRLVKVTEGHRSIVICHRWMSRFRWSISFPMARCWWSGHVAPGMPRASSI
jgi:hypothetical protein